MHRRYFVSYPKKVRIRKAMELLAHSSMRLAEAGNAVGFENTKQFSRMFKELEGISRTSTD
ncbi:helix-turn-helix domain-containing protein [Paenibacillus sp. MER TA 81-3]|nr:helix-turn-helix domain-containing protein [Paenibacillus sp. MER TA 81-3]